MKILCIENNYPPSSPADIENDGLEVYAKPESALIRSGRPFYFPDFTSDVRCVVALVVKIDLLGKSIAPRFAPRYYSEISVGLDFTDFEAFRRCIDRNAPWESAKAIDGSAAIGQMKPVASFTDLQNLSFRLAVNGQTLQEGHSSKMLVGLNDLIARLSTRFTLKTGDFIFTSMPCEATSVRIGDRLEAFVDESKLLDLFVR